MSEHAYTGADNLETMIEARNYNEFLVGEVLGRANRATTAVDFGAGCGTFARALRDRGLEIICVEPDAALRSKLLSQGFECHTGIEAIPCESVDFVFSLNVLEHIEDDEAACRAIFHRLRPGGMCYLYLPAFPVLFTSMDCKVGHWRRYRIQGIRAKLEQAGFDVSDARYVDSLGFAATLLYALFGSRRGDLNPATLRFYDRWLFPISRLIDKVTLGRVFGKNVAVTAVRPAGNARVNLPVSTTPPRYRAAG